MASGSPEHHMDRLGRRLGDRFCNPVLAAEERVAPKAGGKKLVARARFIAWRPRRVKGVTLYSNE
jgi:hypothetical protein